MSPAQIAALIELVTQLLERLKDHQKDINREAGL